MSEHALDLFLSKQDYAHAEDELWCGWGKHWVSASEMAHEYSFACRGCDAAFRKDNEEVEELFISFGGEL